MSCEDFYHNSTPNLYAQTLDELDFEKSIHYACLNNDINRVKTIISKKGGSTVNEIDSTGYAPLHYAARKGYLDICRILIDYGADVNAITPELFSTPLHRASTYNHSKLSLHYYHPVQNPNYKIPTVKLACTRHVRMVQKMLF
ncbi:unnamed protein product [Rhizophagus irregularis]|nr:unnamed protein product [Rhizophagus irregularis]